jgi:hypothetical protein
MNTFKTAILVAAILLFTGCQNMMHKAVVVDTNVKAAKVVLGDASSNFIPQVILGFGRGCLVDMPMQDGAEVFYYSEDSALFSGSMTGKTFIYMKAGSGVIKGHIKVETEDGKIVDIPLFKMYNPFPVVPDLFVDGKVVPPK